MKKANMTCNHTPKMIAVFVAGLAVATLGWYYSDRLNIAFGQSSDINMIASSWNESPSGFRKCSPTDKPKEMRKLNGCQVITTTELCKPYPTYMMYERTRTGTRVLESASAKRGSTLITKYDLAVNEDKKELSQEIDETVKAVTSYKMGKPANVLQKDEQYMNMVKKQEELRNLERQVGTKCRPMPKTPTMQTRK